MPRALIARSLAALTLVLGFSAAFAQSAPPRIQTRPANDNSNYAASTGYVDAAAQLLLNAINSKAPLASPTFTGTATAPALSLTGAGLTGAIDAGTIAGVALPTVLGAKAPLASPTFTGNVTATSLALSGGGLTGAVDAGTVGGTAIPALLNAKAPLASPSFTGTLSIGGGAATLGMRGGEVLFKNNASGLNTLGVQNDSATGYSAFIGHQLDPDWPYAPGGANQAYEHYALGYGAGLSLAGVRGLNYWELSRFTTGNNNKIPPTQGAIQQTGGVDVTGGLSYACSLTAGSTTATCPANSIANGMSVSGPAITPGTTVTSGGGTTSVILSVPSIAVGTQSLTLNFATPAYGQYSAMVFGSGQFPGSYDIDFYRWADGKNGVAGLSSNGPYPFLSLDRVNGRIYVGKGPPSQRLYATAPINVVETTNPVLHSLRIGANTWKVDWSTGPNRVTFTDGNAGAMVTQQFMDGTKRTGFGGPIQLATATVAALPTCNATYQDTMMVATDTAAPTYRGALTGGGTVRTPVYCDGASWTAH